MSTNILCFTCSSHNVSQAFKTRKYHKCDANVECLPSYFEITRTLSVLMSKVIAMLATN